MFKTISVVVALAFLPSATRAEEAVTITAARPDADGVLVHEEIAAPEPVDATLTLTRADFLGGVFGGQPLPAKIASGAVKLDGNPQALLKLQQWMDAPNPIFPIVTR